MNIPTYARYDYVNEKAALFLEEYKITKYPVEPLEIIKRSKWGLMPYSESMEKFSVALEKIESIYRSKDGFTILDSGNYSIAYNDVSKPLGRIRFTLMHEIAHIYLRHLEDFEETTLLRGGLSRAKYKVLENEANAFARNVLVPTVMLYNLDDKSIDNITLTFGITKEAAKARLELYDKDKLLNNKNGLTQKLLNIYNNFIHKRKCLICNAKLVIKSGAYCIICGAEKLIRGDGMITYKTHETNADGIVKVCLNCENDTVIGAFCHICGTHLANLCMSSIGNPEHACANTALLPTSARYCQDCGSMSTLNMQNLLQKWEIEKEALQADSSNDLGRELDWNDTIQKDNDGFMNIPDGIDDIDEELPFN